MNIYHFALGQMQANCYLVEQEGECLIIDPTDEASFILEQIERRRLKLVGIIATHGHFDHVMAAGEIQLTMQAQQIEMPLYIHKEDHFLLKRLVETAKHFLNYEPAVIPIQQTKDLEPGEVIIEQFRFNVIHTPGHTPGSCVLHFKDQNVLFTGDTLFKQGIGRYDFAYSDKEDLKKSIDRIFKLPEETVFYSGHGEEGILEDEKENIKLFF